MSLLTSSDPPCTFLIPIMLSGSMSSNRLTASTTMVEKNSFCRAMSFELREVAAHLISKARISLQHPEGKKRTMNNVSGWEVHVRGKGLGYSCMYVYLALCFCFQIQTWYTLHCVCPIKKTHYPTLCNQPSEDNEDQY